MKIIYQIIFIFSISVCLFGQEGENQEISQNKPINELEENQKKYDNEQQERIKLWKEDSKLLLDIISELRGYRTDSNDTDLQAKFKKDELSKKLMELNNLYKGKIIQIKKSCMMDAKEDEDFSIYGQEQLFRAVNELHKKAGNETIATDEEIKIIFYKIKTQKKGKSLITKKEKNIGQRIEELLKNPLYQFSLAFALTDCKKCYEKTGKFIVIYGIPIPANMDYKTDHPETEYKNISYYSGVFLSEEKNKYSQAPEIKTIEFKIKKIITDKSEALNLQKGTILPLNGKIKSIGYEGNSYNEKAEIVLE